MVFIILCSCGIGNRGGEFKTGEGDKGGEFRELRSHICGAAVGRPWARKVFKLD